MAGEFELRRIIDTMQEQYRDLEEAYEQLLRDYHDLERYCEKLEQGNA